MPMREDVCTGDFRSGSVWIHCTVSHSLPGADHDSGAVTVLTVTVPVKVRVPVRTSTSTSTSTTPCLARMTLDDDSGADT